MKTLTIFLTQLLACGLLAAPSSAQFIPQATAIPGSAPEGINYQGRLEDGGFPVNGTKSMIFRVHSAPVGGVLLWTSPAQAVPVTLGLFSAAVPVPTTVLVGGGARYLEVQIDGTLMAPRELLNSVPYALIAKSVEGNIDVSTAGLAINANSTAVQPALYISSVTGNVGIGTGAPITAFDVGGSAQFGSGTTKSTFSATGELNTAGKITAPDYTATYGINASTAVFTYVLSSSITTTGNVNTQGSVGVGTPNPASKLHLSTGTLIIDGSTANSLTTTGSVGVGTPNPATRLHMSSGALTIDGLGTGINIKNNAALVGILQSGGTGADASWGYLDGTNAAYAGLQGGSGCGAGNYSVYASGCRLQVTQAGDVGIGTINPASKLHMSSGTLTIDGNAATGLQVFGSTFVVNLNGNVGMGTTAPTQRLDVVGNGVVRMSAADDQLTLNPLAAGSGSNIYVTNSAGNAYRPLAFQASTFTFTQGNVGIGTTAPGGTLTVKGNTRFESSGATTPIDYRWIITGPTADYDTLYLSGESVTDNNTFGDIGDGNSIVSFKAKGENEVGIGYDAGATGHTAKLSVNGNVGIGTTSPAVALDVKDQGEFGLGAFTQAQVNAKTPGKVGTLILNSAINQVCVSTGTTIMGYAKIRDGATCQ